MKVTCQTRHVDVILSLVIGHEITINHTKLVITNSPISSIFNKTIKHNSKSQEHGSSSTYLKKNKNKRWEEWFSNIVQNAKNSTDLILDFKFRIEY